MLNVLKDKATSVLVEFKRGEDFFVPDDGSVTYTIRDNDGSEMVGYVDQSLTPTAGATDVVVAIPSGVNALPDGAKFGYRAVIVTYLVNGVTYDNTVRYRVHPYMNFQASADQVRSFMGLHESELPDSEVDMVKAFLEVQTDASSADIPTLLASGDVQAFNVNAAIVYKAVLEAIPSLQLRVAQKQTSDGSSLSRLQELDFNDLEAKARRRLADALDLITGQVRSDAPLLLVTGDDNIFGG